ncbi:hypothetical protein [Bacillus kexueae]|uniref:hypothetical protein n=1 Tax=Aeribacillus kexueae TaxID=2078952 RepID=UPI001FAFE2E4|nr:hypothetical protein [Bacillus kexueae]
MSNDWVNRNLGQMVQINRGGPESRVGKLLGYHEDYLTLYTAEEGLLYFQIHHIKSITTNSVLNAIPNISYQNNNPTQAATFRQLLESLKYQWVTVNRGGPEKLEGVVESVDSDYMMMIVDKEIIRITIFHIKSISYGYQKKRKDLNIAKDSQKYKNKEEVESEKKTNNNKKQKEMLEEKDTNIQSLDNTKNHPIERGTDEINEGNEQAELGLKKEDYPINRPADEPINEPVADTLNVSSEKVEEGEDKRKEDLSIKTSDKTKKESKEIDMRKEKKRKSESSEEKKKKEEKKSTDSVKMESQKKEMKKEKESKDKNPEQKKGKQTVKKFTDKVKKESEKKGMVKERESKDNDPEQKREMQGLNNSTNKVMSHSENKEFQQDQNSKSNETLKKESVIENNPDDRDNSNQNQSVQNSAKNELKNEKRKHRSKTHKSKFMVTKGGTKYMN